MNPALIDAIVQVVTFLAIAGLGMLLKKWEGDAKRKQMVVFAAELAYGAVSNISKLTKNPIDDKAALGLAKVNEYLRSQNHEPLAEHEVATAQAIFDAKHGQEKVLLSANPR